MPTIAGMDLGYGSQIRLVKTNFLLVNADNAKNGTAQAHANLLDLYNNQVKKKARGNSGAVADYIITCADNGGGSATLTAPASGTDPRVVDVSSSTLVHLMGPSRNFLAGQADLSAHQDEAAHIGTSANGKVLAVLGVGMMSFTGTTFTAGVAIDLLGGTAGAPALMNGELLADILGTTADTAGSEVHAGAVPFVDIANLTTDMLASLTGDPTLDLTNTAFTTDYVKAGNAAGNAASDIDDLDATAATTVVADTAGIIQVIALVTTE